ncbi:MAG: sigma-54 dependent transcriptional regulator [Kiritimatiellae bacterium]|nr:sigma-54 dependent transcriptional regulator [Kiritimatiellia bacterium]
MKRLIITGWGHIVYSISAALVLKKYPDADVEGVSKRRLMIRLAELAGNKERVYSEIIIIGVGWRGDQDEIASVLKKLKAMKTKVRWLSVVPTPGWVQECAGKYLDIVVDEEKESLSALVADYFKIRDRELCALDVPDEKRKALNARQREWHLLIQAAQHSYRNYQALDDYPDAVRTLVSKSPLTEKQLNLINHFKLYGHRELTGKSEEMLRIRDIIERASMKDNVRVMIYGKSGTGKETVAIHLHHKSPRSGEPFVAFNCASTSTNLLESQLFGYKKGAFTGAVGDKDGVFKQADGGTLFLDEVGELSLEIQANILRVLQEGRFTPLGSQEEIEVDVRIIAATNRELPRMVKEGKFREDLFFRLNVVPIYMPTLRERMDDMVAIADSCWFGMQRKHLNEHQRDVLSNYDWPGNIRELYNFLEYASVMGEQNFGHLLAEHRLRLDPARQEEVIPDNLDEMIRIHAARVFEKYGENVTHAAEAMGITRNTLKKYLNEETAQ